MSILGRQRSVSVKNIIFRFHQVSFCLFINKFSKNILHVQNMTLLRCFITLLAPSIDI